MSEFLTEDEFDEVLRDLKKFCDDRGIIITDFQIRRPTKGLDWDYNYLKEEK